MQFSLRAMVIACAVAFLVSAPAIASTQRAQVVTVDTSRLRAGNADEIAILHEQVAMMRTYQNSLLETVHWTLGLVGSIAVLLVGYSWFTNFRMYERDKLALSQELRALVEQSLASASQTLSAAINQKTDSLTVAMETTAKASIAQVVAPLSGTVRGLSERMAGLELAAGIASARHWEFRQVPGNELADYQRVLYLAIAHEQQNAIQTALTEISRLMKAGATMFTGNVPELVAALDSLPPRYALDVAAIKALLSTGKCTY